jgi:hypothetical protein
MNIVIILGIIRYKTYCITHYNIYAVVVEFNRVFLLCHICNC